MWLRSHRAHERSNHSCTIVPHYYRRFFFFGLVPIYVRLLFPLFASPCSLHFRRLARILTDAVSVLPPRVSRTWRTYFSLSRGVFSPVRQLVTDHRRGRYRRRLSKVHATEKAGVCSFFKKPEFAWGTRKIGYGGNVVKIKGNTWETLGAINTVEVSVTR